MGARPGNPVRGLKEGVKTQGVTPKVSAIAVDVSSHSLPRLGLYVTIYFSYTAIRTCTGILVLQSEAKWDECLHQLCNYTVLTSVIIVVYVG